MRQQAIAEQDFVGMRNGIVSRLPDIVATALLRHRAETIYVQKIQNWASNNRPLAVLIVVVASLVTISGVWKGIEVIRTIADSVGETLR